MQWDFKKSIIGKYTLSNFLNNVKRDKRLFKFYRNLLIKKSFNVILLFDECNYKVQHHKREFWKHISYRIRFPLIFSNSKSRFLLN